MVDAKRATIARVKNKVTSTAPKADKEYVKIPVTLFEALVTVYANEVMSFKSYEDALKKSGFNIKAVQESVDNNKYSAFADYCFSKHSLKMNTEKLEKPIKRFDPEPLIKILRTGVDTISKPDFKVFRYLNETEIFNRIKTIYIDHLGLDPAKLITITQPFNPEEYGADSLDQIELVMSLEEEFEASFSDDAIEELMKACREYELSFGQVIGMLQRLPT